MMQILSKNISISRFYSFIGVCAVSALLASCSGQVPTQTEIQQDNLDSRAKQLVRVADTTRESGDMANAMQWYARAADMRQDWFVPRLRLGETALSVGQYPDALLAFESTAQLAPKDNLGHNGAGVSWTCWECMTRRSNDIFQAWNRHQTMARFAITLGSL